MHLLVAHVAIHPFASVPPFPLMSLGDHLPNSFFILLFDGEEENSLASYVEETRVLELGFCKEDVVGKEEHAWRSWTNAIVENKYWKYNHKSFKESNWKTFTDVVNEKFSNDVRQNWKQVSDKCNIMKKIYGIYQRGRLK